MINKSLISVVFCFVLATSAWALAGEAAMGSRSYDDYEKARSLQKLSFGFLSPVGAGHDVTGLYPSLG